MEKLLRKMERQLNNTSSEYLEDADWKVERKLKRQVLKEFPDLDITKVCTVHNNYLKLMYESKKEEYKIKYGDVTEKQLYHATSEDNVLSIITDNLDWRRVTRNKYGKGISFSDDPDYANFYSNPSNGIYRAFIIADVLICNSCIGHENMVVPEYGDTALGTDKVWVKFNDHEFLPRYVVYYEAPEREDSKHHHSRRF